MDSFTNFYSLSEVTNTDLPSLAGPVDYREDAVIIVKNSKTCHTEKWQSHASICLYSGEF